MTSRTLKITVAALLFQALLFGPALAQDFDSLMAGATSANQQAVEQIDLALGAQEEATFRLQAANAVASAQQAESQLREALAVAPDDASRSRAEGVLTHITDALRAGQAALQTTDFNTARSQIDAMRGEAQEALSELAPFALPGAPSELPSTGELPTNPLAGRLAAELLALIGLLAVATGFGLRRRLA